MAFSVRRKLFFSIKFFFQREIYLFVVLIQRLRLSATSFNYCQLLKARNNNNTKQYQYIAGILHFRQKKTS